MRLFSLIKKLNNLEQSYCDAVMPRYDAFTILSKHSDPNLSNIYQTKNITLNQWSYNKLLIV